MERRGIATAAAGLALALSVCLASPASAAPIVLSGNLDDPANPALEWSDLGPALFDNDNNIANNVAVYAFALAVESTVTFESLGFAAGGIEPYLSVFSGDGSGALFVDSSGLSDPLTIDFLFSRVLDPGNYMLAIGSWQNMSFAENDPDADPSLGDGFIALGVPSAGSYYYELHVTCEPVGAAEGGGCAASPSPVSTTGDTTGNPVPEPASLLLGALSIGVAALRTLRRRG